MLKRRIKRITIKNYRSIADLTVELPDLTVLVGENGSGKSNFVDALRFLSDAMFILISSIEKRRGISNLFNRNSVDDELSIETICEIDNLQYIYVFVIKKIADNEYVVKREYLERNNKVILHYENNHWHITPDNIVLPQPSSKLTLPLLEDYADVSPIYKFLNEIILTPMNFASTSQEFLQEREFFQSISNLGSSLYDIENKLPHRKSLLDGYLTTLVPFISSVQIIQLYDAVIKIRFIHQNGKMFDLVEESLGTQHILKLLVSLLQINTPALLIIEEPELFVHPGILPMLCEIIEEASLRQQIIVTTHSPDLIAHFDVNSIRVVEMTDEGTKIDMIDEGILEAVNKKLFNTSDILSMEGRLRRRQHDA